MNDPYFTAVKEFHSAFGHPVGSRPEPLVQMEAAIRADFMFEELQEFAIASDLAGQVHEIIDLIYVAFGTLVQAGVEPSEIFQAVHRANMRKLQPDGTVKYRVEDGKVLKPDNWTGPEDEIAAILERQAAVAALQEAQASVAAFHKRSAGNGYELKGKEVEERAKLLQAQKEAEVRLQEMA